MEKPQSTEQERLENLKVKLRKASSSPIPIEDLESLSQEHDEVTNKFIRGEKDLEGYKEGLPETRDERGVATFDNLGDFISAIKLIGFQKEAYEWILSHENEHMNKAETLGLKASYQIRFIKKRNGRLDIRPSISIPLSEENKHLDSSILRDIVSAPGELSPTDRAKLEGV